MRNVYLFQPQFTTIVHGKLNGWLPYSIGTIWSYASQFENIVSQFQLKELIFKFEDPNVILDRLDNPSVCGFSCYLWNKNYCLTIAELIKKKFPKCLIIFGGPEVNGTFLKYRFIDSISNGEGEENFHSLLLSILDDKEIPTIFNKTRLTNLDIPSPYLSGVFSDIIKNNPDIVWAMTLETNRGCPYSCTFCDWGSLTYSKVRKFNLDRVEKELEWLKQNPIAYIYVADANFGMFKERDLQIAKMLKEATDNSQVDLITIQSAKHSTKAAFEIGKVLGQRYAGVTVSMQSMNDATLDAIKRKNLDINNIQELMRLSQKYDVPTYTELILGLPLETIESWKNGLTELLELGQHNSIDIWFTQLLENSELNNIETKTKYGIETVNVKNYAISKSETDYSQISEDALIVNKTNTMTTTEMVDSYMYGWMIMQFHITGYSQIISRYLRKKHNISYRKFYDRYLEKIKQDPILSKHYIHLRNNVMQMLTSGTTDNGISPHRLHTNISIQFYEIKDHIMNFTFECASELITVPESVFTLQKYFIFDANHTYPINHNINYDINSGRERNTKYTINYRIPNDYHKQPNNTLVRRRGLLKNSIKSSPATKQ
jgi:putative methyltransferase